MAFDMRSAALQSIELQTNFFRRGPLSLSPNMSTLEVDLSPEQFGTPAGQGDAFSCRAGGVAMHSAMSSLQALTAACPVCWCERV